MARDGAAARTQLPGLLGEWFFWPDYTLPGNAGSYPGPRVQNPMPPTPIVSAEDVSLQFFGQPATEHYARLAERGALPVGPFTVEMWIENHVNLPIGALAGIVSTSRGATTFDWVLGYFDRSLVFGVPSEGGHQVTIQVAEAQFEGYKRYWHHVAGVYDGARMMLFHNGALMMVTEEVPEAIAYGDDPSLSVAAFLGQELYMDLANAVQYVALYDRALTQDEIRGSFAGHAQRVDNGIVFRDLFHFTAGPYLNLVTQHSVNVLWETDRPARGRIEWGPTTPLTQALDLEIDAPVGQASYGDAERPLPLGRLKEVSLTGLQPNTPYFYRVTATDEHGDAIGSEVLSFRTAVGSTEAFSFAIMGDTEARPHVNDRLAKLVWGERPNFLLLLGDLTDGGMRDHRFQWTHEFFPGLLQVVSRIPTFAVLGNGEADLYWYRHYHHFPGAENYFSFRFGNTDFFVLDSNMAYHDRAIPGFRRRQRDWFEAALQASDATWKIAAHHHPVYTSDEDDYGNTWESTSELGDVRVRNDFMDLYETYGVDLVLFAHLHTYERSWPVRDGGVSLLDGVIYVQAGGGGGNTEDFAPTRNWFTNTLYRGYHYGIFTVSGPYLEFKARDAEGRLRDQFTLHKDERKSGRGVLVGTAGPPREAR